MQKFVTRDVMKYFTHSVPSSLDTTALYGKRTIREHLRYNMLLATFKANFGADGCCFASAPGRVEVIGNHTDHNGGSVIGATVDTDMLCAFATNKNGVVHIKNKGRADVVFALDDIDNVEPGSIGMVKGVLSYLRLQGYNVGGFNAVLDSKIPSGAGLSSGAALQVLVGCVVNALYNDGKIPAETLAKAGQYAENKYFGKPCGLLDQGAIALGGIVAMDFACGFTYSRFPSILTDYNLVVVNTGGSHAPLTALYAQIPEDMAAVAKFFGMERLCEVEPSHFYGDFENVCRCVGERQAKRAKHFFDECDRVAQMKVALQSGNQHDFVRLVNESGDSSMNLLGNCSYDGNSAIKDAVCMARKICPDGAARVHGGGFAGTVLCVVPKNKCVRFLLDMSMNYGPDNVRKLSVRSCGACVL